MSASRVTTSSDGDVPGTVDFLYVADSKLCAREVMDAIDAAGGRPHRRAAQPPRGS
jgi:hypothetical protein